MKHDQLAHTERICEQWVHAGVRAASDEKGNIHSNNENNQNKWCVACDCMQTCLGMRAHCITAEWHGLHAYSGVSVAHDMCIHARALVRVLVWNRRYVPLPSRPEMRIKLSPSWSRLT